MLLGELAGSVAPGLSALDYFVLLAVLAALSVTGFIAGRGEQRSSEEYFLAGRKLPWYVVCGSFTASGISSEHFIGMVGASFLYGICMALWEWSGLVIFTFMIFVYVPILMASKVFTIPEFLENHFGKNVKNLFVVVTVLANVVTFMAAVLYAGGIALQSLTGVGLEICIVAVGLFSGIWAIYGGLSSVAWTDLLTVVVMFVGGLLVTGLGLQSLSSDGSIYDGFLVMLDRNSANHGIWKDVLESNLHHFTSGESYDRLSVFQRPDHPMAPLTGMLFGLVSVVFWYNMMNQFIIQRILGAKDMWHARMAIVSAGFVRIFLPLIIVFPGLILFAMHPELMTGDWADVQRTADGGYVTLVNRLLPAGLRGLVIAALIATIQSTVNSVLNSTSTILTMDIYKPGFGKHASDSELVRFGVISSVVALLVSMLIAYGISLMDGGVFHYIQSLNAFFAPPFAAIFLLGLFWGGGTHTGALTGVLSGFSIALLIKIIVIVGDAPGWLQSFSNQSGVIWSFSLIVCWLTSLSTQKSSEPSMSIFMQTWTQKKAFGLGLGNRWANSVFLWWSLFVVAQIAIILFFSGRNF